MSLPMQYSNAISYFDDVAEFLKTYEWIYNYPNTDILLNRVFEKFPLEWIEFFKNNNTSQLNDLSIGVINEPAPETLKTLLKKINSFKPHYETNNKSLCNVHRKNTKISEKKRHEINRLSSIIRDICNKVNSDHIIDVGSGLGYLPELLHEKYTYKILGLEGNADKLKLAIERQNKLHPSTKSHIKYHHHFVTQSSATVIENLITSKNENYVLSGLHACADLSVIILKQFLELDFVKGLVIMPCCYHRLELLEEVGSGVVDKFRNFPVSDAFTEIYNRRGGGEFLRRYFLRLACQQSAAAFFKMNDGEHRVHGEQCLFRAILEEAAEEENCHVSRNKRKTGRPPLKTTKFTFDDYINNLKTTHTLTPNANNPTSIPHLIDSPSFKEKMHRKWHQYKSHCYLVEVLTALQMAIQSVCENLVLLDRVEFLRERGVECWVCKVTDDRISPRCYALVATKL